MKKLSKQEINEISAGSGIAKPQGFVIGSGDDRIVCGNHDIEFTDAVVSDLGLENNTVDKDAYSGYTNDDVTDVYREAQRR